MSITYGLTSTGFVSKPLAEVEAEIDAALQAGPLGASAGTEPDGTIPLDTAAGQLKVIWTDGISAMWDLLQAVYASFDPNSATGVSQDAICAITGTIREPVEYSAVTATCTGTPLTVLPAGRRAQVKTTGAYFDSVAPATIVVAPVWAPATPYVVGNRVGSPSTGATNVYQCITAGTSAGGTGPTGTGADITDNTAHWKWLGAGAGVIDVTFSAEVAGQIGANVGDLSVIATPVAGWSNVTNLLAASVGQLQESDAALRVRRNEELAIGATSTQEAIRSAILRVNQNSTDALHVPVKACTVFHNDTDVTDANGVPPHSVEVLALYGDGVTDVPTTDQDIANAVFANVAAGIATYGNQTASVTDSQLNVQTVRWSKPVAVPIYIVATVYYDPAQWPPGSSALVVQTAKSAIVTYGDNFSIGTSVRMAALSQAFFDGPAATDITGTAIIAPPGSLPTTGVLDVTPLYFGTAPSPVSSTVVTITSRQLATFNLANVTITATSESP